MVWLTGWIRKLDNFNRDKKTEMIPFVCSGKVRSFVVGREALRLGSLVCGFTHCEEEDTTPQNDVAGEVYQQGHQGRPFPTNSRRLLHARDLLQRLFAIAKRSSQEVAAADSRQEDLPHRSEGFQKEVCREELCREELSPLPLCHGLDPRQEYLNKVAGFPKHFGIVAHFE